MFESKIKGNVWEFIDDIFETSNSLLNGILTTEPNRKNEDGSDSYNLNFAGYKKEDIKITIVPSNKYAGYNVLKIVGKNEKWGEKTGALILDQTHDIDSVSAKFEDGILEITVSKKTTVSPVKKEITIK